MTEYRCNTEGCSVGDCDNCRAVAALRADKARLDFLDTCDMTVLTRVVVFAGDGNPVRRQIDNEIAVARADTRPHTEDAA